MNHRTKPIGCLNSYREYDLSMYIYHIDKTYNPLAKQQKSMVFKLNVAGLMLPKGYRAYQHGLHT